MMQAKMLVLGDIVVQVFHVGLGDPDGWFRVTEQWSIQRQLYPLSTLFQCLKYGSFDKERGETLQYSGI